MKRRFSVLNILLLCASLCPAGRAQELKLTDLAPPTKALVDVGDRAQLFVDRTLVYQTERVWFTQHQGAKHPANPLVVADQPWEGWRVQIYGNVLYDQEEKIFKMWYYSEGRGNGCYATSTDGIQWEKPPVGRHDAESGKRSNVVFDHFLPSVIKDTADPDPTRRYKMTCARPDSRYKHYTYWTMVSPDGLRWKLSGEKPLAPGFDVVTSHWDPFRKLHVSFVKNHQLPWRGHWRRVFDLTASKDFENWSTPIPAFRPDLRDDASTLARVEQARPLLDRADDPARLRTEFYGVGAYPHESCTIAFPWVISINNNARWGNHEGPAEIQLAASRDLVEWHRPFRTPVIAKGKPGQWDSGYHTTASSAIRVGDEIRLYFSGANYTHGTPAIYRTQFEDGKSTGRGDRYTSSIGLVTWKLDRFVSVDGPASGGTLTTVPMKFTGDRLELNALTKPKGQIVVELLDASARPIKGFARSSPIKGDDLRHQVKFSGDISQLSGHPITLRFHLTNASLFSFAFRKNDG